MLTLEEINMVSTMKVLEVFHKKIGTRNSTYCTVECNSCKIQLNVRADAIKIGGYKEQKLCRKCSYEEIHGSESNNLTINHRRLYNVYKDMIRRCTSSKNYSDKGVTVCDDWLVGFKPFLEWALSQGHSETELEKMEIDKDFICDREGISPKIYSPSTCMFVSRHFNNIIKPKRQVKVTSKYIGVNWNKSLKRWEWGLRLGKDKRKRGYATSELEAAKKRESYIQENFLAHKRNFDE